MYDIGAKQGCPFSPTLVGLFIETYMGLKVHHGGVQPATFLDRHRAVVSAR
jgi:hypothetical protein